MDGTRAQESGPADDILAGLRNHASELLEAGRAHQHGQAGSVRTAEFRGHQIRIRTTYEVSVDGRPFPIEANVDNAGRVHYHGLPTRNFSSAVDLVADAIDAFPDDFAEAGSGHEPHHDPPTPDDSVDQHGHGHPGGPR